MNKVAFVTVHPAPYIDTMIDNHLSKNDVSLYVLCKSTNEKPWLINDGNYRVLSSVRQLLSYDEIILPGWYNWRIMYYTLILKLSGAKVSLFMDHYKTNQSIPIFVRYYLSIMYKIYPATYALLFILKKYDFREVELLPYGLSSSSFYKYEDYEIEYNMNKRNIYIANRFIERKGWRTFISSLGTLNVNSGISLSIGGTGTMEGFIRQSIKNLGIKHEFLGWQEPKEYEASLVKCDIFIHFSDFEPFGIPPLDAFVLGKVVVVSDKVFSMLPFVGSSGVFHFRASDKESLSQALSEALLFRGKIKVVERQNTYRSFYVL